MKKPNADLEDLQQGLPEYEVSDDTYVETRESRTSLEKEMALKAFTESGIHAALYVLGVSVESHASLLMAGRSGGAPDLALSIGGNIGWQNAQSSSTLDKESTTAIHGFYNVESIMSD